MKRFLIGVTVSIFGALLVLGIYLVLAWNIGEKYEVAGVPVLNYHAINDRYHSPLVMKEKHFKEQMAYLSKEGYHTITLDQLYNYMTKEQPLPEKPILITFDDGYVDNYETVLPILEQYQFKAVLFMIGDSVGRAGFVTKDMLIHMEKHGFEVQGHTYSHRPMTSLRDDDMQADLQKSREVLEGIVGHPIRYLAYPRGLKDERVEEIVKKEGYRMAFTVSPGNVKVGDNLFSLHRMPIFEGDFYFNLFKVRLHFSTLVSKTWRWRLELKKAGYVRLSKLIPIL